MSATIWSVGAVEPVEYQSWLSDDPDRRSVESDFGSLWTSQSAPGDFRVSFMHGTGELIVVDDREHQVRVLGRFQHLYAAEEALGLWSEEAIKPGSLDRLTERFPDYRNLVTVAVPDPRPVYGVVLDVNGDRERVHEPMTGETLAAPFSDAISDMYVIGLRGRERGLTLWAEETALDQSVNPTATALAGHGHPINGRALLCSLDQPIDPTVVDAIDPPRSVHRDWVAQDFTRRLPDIDYGTTWTSNADLDETWRVSWNPGSGELYRINSADTALQVLGVYTPGEIETAMDGWGSLADRPGGLDQLAGMPPVAEPRFVDRVDELEQRAATYDDLDAGDADVEPDAIDTLSFEPVFNDEMDIS
jgi:hypothetical protein